MTVLSVFDNPFMIILVLLAFFGVIALVVFLLRKHLPFLKDEDNKPLSEEDAAQEALDRILVDMNEEEKKELDDDLTKDDEKTE